MKNLYRIGSLGFAGMLVTVFCHAQTIYYVKANAGGNNNGSSWTNAFNDIQSAFDMASNGDQIWVAGGTYKPSKDESGNTNPADTRKKVFILKNGVKLYGGFAGTETSIAQRNIQQHQTILSGDLSGNDQDGFINMSDNAYHVVGVDTPDAPTVLDGMTIKGGNSDNGTFEALFLGQNFGFLYGGGIFSVYGSDLTISNCVVTGNVGYHGGGMLARGTAPEVINCVFTKNKATRAGGAIFFENSMSAVPVITNTVIDNNIAGQMGGGIFNRYSNTLIVNTTMVNNTVPANGGTIYNESPSSPVIKNCIIYKNSSGAPITNDGSAVTTVTYTNIEAGYTGAGNISSDPIFNKLSDADGADNTWRTDDDGLHLRGISQAANAGNDDDATNLSTDIIGVDRVQNAAVNMGAYETLKPTLTYFVKQNASGSNTGSSWANAFTSLQSALEISENGDEIWVAEGTYLPSKDESGNETPNDPRKKAFILKNGVKLYGGFMGIESSTAERDFKKHQTILSGDLNHDDSEDFINMGDNCYHVIGIDNPASPTVLDGVVVKGGNSDNGTFEALFLGQNFGFLYGGGIFSVYGSDLTISNCVVTGNVGYHGGGMLARGTAPEVINCVFTKNKATRAGGAIFFENSMSAVPVITNTVIANNIAGQMGGGIFNRYSNTLIVNTTMVNNTAANNGAAMYNESPSSTILENAVVWANTESTGIVNETGASATVNYSLVQGGYAGTGNIDADPLFVSITDGNGTDDVWMTTDDGLALISGSPAADEGLNAAIIAGVTTDITGDQRMLNAKVNMGAYERVKQLASVTVSNITGIYTGSNHDVVVTTDPAGLSTSVIYSQGAVITQPVDAGAYDVLVEITDLDYSGYAVATLHIDKANQAISIAAIDDKLVEDQFEIQAASTSELPLSFTSGDESIAIIEGQMVTLVGAGEVTFTATQSGSLNYNAATAQVTFTVSRKTQAITFEPLAEKILGEKPFALQGESSSGLTLTYASANTAVATVNDNMITIVGSGETEITAYQDGNNIYEPATPVAQTLVVRVVTGIETSYGKGVTVYPNPAADHIQVEGYDEKADRSVIVVDNSGRSLSAAATIINNTMRLDLTRLPAGIYFLKVVTKDGVTTKKIIKQ